MLTNIDIEISMSKQTTLLFIVNLWRFQNEQATVNGFCYPPFKTTCSFDFNKRLASQIVELVGVNLKLLADFDQKNWILKRITIIKWEKSNDFFGTAEPNQIFTSLSHYFLTSLTGFICSCRERVQDESKIAMKVSCHSPKSMPSFNDVITSHSWVRLWVAVISLQLFRGLEFYRGRRL